MITELAADSLIVNAAVERRNRTKPPGKELAFRVLREVPGEPDELLARAVDLKLARAAYAAAANEYPEGVLVLKQGMQVIEQSSRR